MELMDGYKQTETGVIPEDWDDCLLGTLFEITSSKRVFQSEWKSQGVPFYRARELAVLSTTDSVDNDLFIDKSLYDSFKKHHGVPLVGDLLVTGVGTLGKVFVVPDGRKFYFKDGNIIWFKIAGAINSEFLRQLYLTPVIEKQISEGAAGTTVGTYTISDAKMTSIPLPPTKTEQTAIANALSDTDSWIQSLTRLIAKKRQIKQGATQTLLTGQKRLQEFVTSENYKHSEVGAIPSDWVVKSLGSLIRVKNGFAFSSTYFSNKGPIVLTPGNFKLEGGLYFNHRNTKRYSGGFPDTYRFEVGDLLIVMTDLTPNCKLLGKPAFVEQDNLLHNQRIGKILLKDKEVSIDFLYCFLNSESFNRRMKTTATGSTVRHTSVGSIYETLLPLPSTKTEQTAIVSILSGMDSEIMALETKLTKAKQIKQGMMQNLLTGRIRLI